jgi:hypothetical protein
MGTISKMILWLGGSVMFRASEAAKNDEKITRSRIFSWFVQELAYYFGRGIENRGKEEFSYRKYVETFNKRHGEKHYPLLDMGELSGWYDNKEVTEEDILKT